MLGGFGNLIIFDADDSILSQLIEEKLPRTFTVKTPSSGYHYYFYCKDICKKIVLTKNYKHYGEIISKGGQVVGPGSIHPDTLTEYEVYHDLPIREVSLENFYPVLGDYIQDNITSHSDETQTDLKITDILNINHIKTRRAGNQLVCSHPVHGSTTGHNFVVSPEKNVWHCFRCSSGGDPFYLIAVLEGIIDCSEAKPGKLRGEFFKRTLQVAQEKYGFKKESFDTSQDADNYSDYKEVEKIEQMIIRVPQDTDRTKLSLLLEPILRKIAGLNPIQADALLRHNIKKRFAFNNHEINKYDSLLKQYRKEQEENTPKKKNDRKEIISILSAGKNHQKIQPAQDYCNSRMFFAVLIDEKWYLLTSERELIDFEEAEDNGLVLEHKNVDTSNFSHQGILTLLEKKEHLNVPELYESIYSYIKRFIYFPDESYLHYISLWIMGTYCYRIFRYYPYVWLNAEKGSGKTLLMEIISPIAFNGELITSPTEAVIFRDIANNQVTMFIDEVEQLRKRDKDAFISIISVLNTGFNKSGYVKRAEGNGKGGFTIKKYLAYSPKMFAGINEIDDVLRDRTVKIPLLRKKESELVERYKETEDIKKVQQTIRDNLYILSLTLGPEIAEIYSSKSELIQGMSHLSNRDLDIWEPIFILANAVDGQKKNSALTDMMEKLSKKSSMEKMEESIAQNETQKVLKVLQGMLEDKEPISIDGDIQVYDAQEVLNYFKATEEFEWIEKTNVLTRRLKKADIKSEQRRIEGIKQRVYIVNVKRVKDLCERYGMGIVNSDMDYMPENSIHLRQEPETFERQSF